MLFLNVIPIFTARGIERPHTYLTKAGFTPHSAHYILHGKTRSIRLDHIEKLRKLLICEPADLFVWYPDKNEILNDKHPLKKLIRREEEANIHNLIADIPFKDIAKIAAAIKEQKDDAETKKEA
ncbi:helix-turn-helix domain-containing protein [Pedobacter ghigonis]|uniref:helix-turn-helix domain-containing protein n=1 Tax=Pedobacter ghigonis TaxID=2730403 RepID=UPI001588CC40|nr:helix-turn-helix transcriptional regulator [Pedobacter ghigonis]